MGFFDRLKAGLSKTRQTLTAKLEQTLLGYADISDELLDEIEEVLIAADVGVATTERLMGDVRAAIKRREIRGVGDVRPFLQQRITEILVSGGAGVRMAAKPPTVILLVGVNGAGKTTTVGKLAAFYAYYGKRVLIAAADTFRAGAIEQVAVWAERAGAELIRHGEGSDPAAVVFDAVNAALARQADILLVDTAGRLQTKANLMAELAKMTRVITRAIPGAPHETLLVLDATSGQNAVSQAKQFAAISQVTGLVLTKLDGTAKGGVVIGVKAELGLPVKWIGVGEGVADLRPFDADEFAKALFG